MNVIDAFVVSFGLNPSDYKKGEREVLGTTKRLREDTKKTFDAMEDRAKKGGELIQGLSNKVIGLGLAFMGASTISSFVKDMMLGAASADRLGQTMAMNTEKVWAWRRAVESIGGQQGEADAALQTLQADRMNYILGRMDGDKAGIYARFGISGSDFENSNPGDLLLKISAMQSKMDPQLFAKLTAQLGLSQNMVYLLQEGQPKLEKLISDMEKNSAGQDKLAKQTEELQKGIAELKTTIASDLVPVLVRIVDWLNSWMGGETSEADMIDPDSWANQGPIGTFLKLLGWGGSKSSSAPPPPAQGAYSGSGYSSVAVEVARRFGLSPIEVAAIMSYESGGTFDPGKMGGKGGRYMGLIQMNPQDRAKYGVDGSSSPAQWSNAIIKYLEAHGFRYGMNGLDLYSTINAGRPGRYGWSDGNGTVRSHYGRIMREHQGNARRWLGGPNSLHISQVIIHSNAKDGKALARDFHAEMSRRHAVAQADRGMMA